MKVCKFGGSSLADADQVRRVCAIVESDPARRLIVVSAPGKRHADDTKVTDLLIACADARLRGETAEDERAAVEARYASMAEELELPGTVMDEIRENLRQCVSADRTHEARFVDGLKAAGEDNSARLVAATLTARGSQAAYVDPKEAGMLLSDEYGNAQLLEESYSNLAALKDRPGITVFPGFFGATREGHIATFPRGGSDITGSIVAVAVGADAYENFTDVDSVFAADPRIVPDVKAIPELTFREMRELSYAGFSVIHEEAIIPAVRAGIPICVKNTNAPDTPGTRIVRERESTHGRIVGIASGSGFCTIYVSKYLMNREIGFGRRLLAIFEREGLSYEHTPSGIDNMSIILRESELEAQAEARVMGAIRADLATEDVEVEHGLALLMVVGEGMRYTVGLAARATHALAEAGVNIEMMNQGSSEISMMFGVKAVDREKAVKALYGAFFA